MASRLVLIAALGMSACSGPSGDLSGFACEQGRCLDGFSCHPERFVCVPTVEASCSGGGLCPSDVETGDACTTEQSFIPCIDGVRNCDGGCRTCEDGQWGDCTEPACILGQPFSCASCEDDCSRSVLNATPLCAADGNLRSCDYLGSCRDGALDADGDRRNGCECIPGSEEVCDGIDNDCDGETDEGFEVGDPCGEGVCAGGVTECNDRGTDVRCATGPGGSSDASGLERCDALDNDCNGSVDEGFECVSGEATVCDPGTSNLGLVLCDPLNCVASPCQEAFGAGRLIGFSRVGRSATLADFPVPIRLSSTNVESDRLTPDGGDIRFFEAGGFLDHEIEVWEPAGVSEIWVAVPRLEPNQSSQRIELLYDGRLSELPTVVAAQTWRAYRAVLHLDGGAPGTGNPYRDATSNGFDAVGDGETPGVPGVVGDAIQPDAGEVLTLPPGLGGGGPLAISFWASPPTERPAYRLPVALSTETEEANEIVALHLDETNFDFSHPLSDARDLDVLDDAGNPLDYWIERWSDGDALIWVELSSAGTDSFQLVYGRNVTLSRSSIENTLRPGLWWTGWNTAGEVSNNAAEMAAFFSRLDYTTAAAAGGGVVIDCGGSCNPQGASASYATVYEGWIVPETPGTVTFGVNIEEAMELWLGGSGFKDPTDDATLVAGLYGTRGGGSGVDTLPLPTYDLPAVSRLMVRMQDNAGGQSQIRLELNEATVTTSQTWHAPRYTPAIVATPGVEELIAVDVELGPIEIGAADGLVVARLGAAQVSAPIPSGYRFIAVNYEPATGELTLFVDGNESGTATELGTTVGATAPLRLGHISNSPLSAPSALDELRVSATLRSEAWLTASWEAVSAGLVTYP